MPDALTPQEIASGTSCMDCVDDVRRGRLVLLNEILFALSGSRMTPQEIASGTSCMDCVDDLMKGSMVLENAILAASGGGGGGGDFTYTRSAIDPVAAPPTANAQHYNTVSQVLWQWDGAAWV